MGDEISLELVAAYDDQGTPFVAICPCVDGQGAPEQGEGGELVLPPNSIMLTVSEAESFGKTLLEYVEQLKPMDKEGGTA